MGETSLGYDAYRIPMEASVEKVRTKAVELVGAEPDSEPAARVKPRAAAGKRRGPAGDTQSRAANSTAERAIDILLLFNDEKPYWTANEIATYFGMPKSTVYRYVNGLRSYGLIEEDRQYGFRLGPRVFPLARTAKANLTIVEIAGAQLRKLAEQTGEMVVLQQRVGSDIVPLERIASSQRITLASTRSHMLPWPATSSAKLLLAYTPPAEQQDIIRVSHPTNYTSHTLQSKAALKVALEQIVRDGYALTNEERDEGVWGVAAPIFEHDTVRYAVAIAVPAFRVTPDKARMLIDGVVGTAKQITAALAETEF